MRSKVDCGSSRTNPVADECDIAGGNSEDCNDNDIPDECDTIEAGSR